jgi:hypothetical protein
MTDTSTTKRWALTAGAAGLVGGLALGATGLAAAVTPHQEGRPAPHHRDAGPGMGFGTEGPGGRHHPGLAKRRGGGGLVSGISATTLNVRTPRGTQAFGLNDSTTYYTGKTKATRAAVEVGDVVRVLVADPRAEDPVASVVTVLPARLDGWVTAVNGSSITLTDHDGFTRQLSTSSSTQYRKDGAAATAAALTVGSFVHAIGDVADDGTTLKASRVEVGFPAKRAERPAPRGARPGDAEPSGAGQPDV